MPVIPAPEKLREEEGEFQASLHGETLSQKLKKKKCPVYHLVCDGKYLRSLAHLNTIYFKNYV
jgi:hypothetical protein